MDADEAVRRWLDADNSGRPWTEEEFDDDLHGYLFLDADAASRLDVIVALGRHDLTIEAMGLLGAGLFEDLLADSPEMLPRLKAAANAEPRLRRIIACAWETSRMSEDAKAFLQQMQRWAALNDLGPAGTRPTRTRAT